MASCEIPVLRVDSGAQYETDKNCDSPDLAHKLYRETQGSSVSVLSKRGSASGFFLAGGQEVVTNAHVVKNATKLKVETSDGKSYVAEIEKIDDINDLALLKIKNIEKSDRGLKLGASAQLAANAQLFGLGHPNGSKEVWISPGRFQVTQPMPNWVIDPEKGDWPTWVEAARSTDTKLSGMAKAYLESDRIGTVLRGAPGNSGSPLMDSTGKVVGVMADGFDATDPRNLMLSVPVEKLKILVGSPSKYKFVYEYRSAFAENAVGTAVVDGALVGSSFLFPKAAPALIGTLSIIDVPFQVNRIGNDQYNQPNTYLKIGTEALTAVGGLLSLFPQQRALGRTIYGVGLGGMVLSDLLPYERSLSEIKDKAGDIVKPLFWD